MEWVNGCPQIIIINGEFKRIADPRKFACYAGAAVFEHSLGIRVEEAGFHHLLTKR